MSNVGSASNQNLDRLGDVKDIGKESNPTITAKKNYSAVKYGTDKGTLKFGSIHKKGDVTSGVMLDTPDGRHQFSLDIDGQRKGWTTSTSPGNFSLVAGEDNTEPQDTIFINAVNGNIDICATNGKIRLQATDIELIAVGEGGSKGHIKCTATETFSVYETKKIILDSKSLTKITSTGSINIAANTMMKIYGSLIKAVTDASAVKNSKTNGQNDVVSNNVVSSSSEGD
tara:strand:- start:869 stop:1552 length:684 start_codon:yes stop_codon:yes gene_type:complete